MEESSECADAAALWHDEYGMRGGWELQSSVSTDG
jgi:hypothetical protein